MVSWATVVVAVCLVFLVYFGYRGIKYALTTKDLPDPAEGDYEIKVVGKTGKGQLLAVMTPRKVEDEKEST